MNRLQLATLLSWAGENGLRGRKRLQKVVFFLQQAGCPLDCRYTLHHFGPYSRDVADACDEIVAAGLVDETGGSAGADMQYTYRLKATTHELLQKTPDAQMNRFEKLGTELINENLWTLELGSTILFFYCQAADWDHALARACEFKKVSAKIPQSQAALALAKGFEAKLGN
jgi:uncharacterized protein YwgA